jgi:hypothetical protein
MAGKLDQSAGKLNSGNSAMTPPALRILKILVVVMGVLIVAGVVTVVATIISRLSAGSGNQAVEAGASQAALAAFGRVSRQLPGGARVISVAAGSGRLFVHYETVDGRARVLVLNGATGEELGELRFEAAD